MITPVSRSGLAIVALCTCLALMSGFTSAAEGAQAAEEPTSGAAVRFQRESAGAFHRQLADHTIRSATFNVLADHLHLLMKDRRLMLVDYRPAEKAKIEGQLRAAGVLITAERATAAPVHHKLRYILGGVLIVAIVAVTIVLLLGRRRKLAQERATAE